MPFKHCNKCTNLINYVFVTIITRSKSESTQLHTSGLRLAANTTIGGWKGLYVQCAPPSNLGTLYFVNNFIIIKMF